MPRLPLILILMILVATILFPARAQATYKPGVKPGDTITYGQVSASWVSDLNPQSPFADFLNVSTVQNTITGVDQDNLTFQQTKTYNNGTTNAARFFYNVQSGLGNYTTYISWLIASGLAAPEATYESPNAPPIGETVEKVYLNTVRTVNVLTTFQTFYGGYFSAEVDFDQQTGILLYLTITEVYSNYYYVTAHLNIMITQTSLWSPPNQPDYAFYANPFTAVVLKGANVNSTVILQSLNNFQGPVTLSATTSPIGPAVSLNQTTPSLSIGGSASILLTFSTTPATPAALYIVNVTATTVSLVHYTILNITVTGPAYTLTPSPAYISIPTNSSGTDIITSASIDRFNGTITLKASPLTPGPSLTLNPATISVKAGSNTTTLTINTQRVTAGYYTLELNGTGPLLQPAYVYLNVLPGPPDFTISLNPSLATYQLGPGAVSYIVLKSVNGFTGTIDLNEFWVNGSSTIFIGLSNPYLSAYGTATVQVKVFSPPIGLGCCGILQITGTSGSLSHTANLNIYVPPGPDFTVTVAPKSLDVPQGVQATANVTVTNTGTVAGSIFFTGSVSPGIVSGFTFSSWSVNLAPGASGTVLLQVPTTTAALGTYNFTITAYDLGHSHSTKLTLIVLSPSAGFTITPTSGLVTVQPGSSSTPTTSLTSLDNFYGNTTLTATPSNPGLTTSWTSQTVGLQPNSTVSTSLTITASNSLTPGTYSVIVSASSNGIILATTITVKVAFPADFNIVIAPSQLTMQPGTSATAAITLNGIFNFNGTITLTTQLQGAGPVTNLSAQTTTLSYSTSTKTITLTVSLPSNAPPGSDYIITINATDGSTAHQVNMTVAATTPSSSAGLTMIYLITGIVTAAVASSLSVLVITRHRKTTPN